MLAVKLGAYKEYQEAEELLNKALKTDPDNPHVNRYIGKHFRNQVGLSGDSSVKDIHHAGSVLGSVESIVLL